MHFRRSIEWPYHNGELIAPGEDTIAGCEAQHIGARTRKGRGGIERLGITECDGTRAIDLALGHSGGAWWDRQAIVGDHTGQRRSGWQGDALVCASVDHRRQIQIWQ